MQGTGVTTNTRIDQHISAYQRCLFILATSACKFSSLGLSVGNYLEFADIARLTEKLKKLLLSAQVVGYNRAIWEGIVIATSWPTISATPCALTLDTQTPPAGNITAG